MTRLGLSVSATTPSRGYVPSCLPSASPDRPGRIGEVRRRRGDLLLGHLVRAIDDLEKSASRGFDAPGWHQIRGVERGVIDDVVDDMEARRLHMDLRKLAAGARFGLAVGGDPELPERPADQRTQCIAAAHIPAPRADFVRR